MEDQPQEQLELLEEEKPPFTPPVGLVNSAEPAGNVSASACAGTTRSGAAGIVSDDLLTNEDRVSCQKCTYLTFDCDNWIGGLGRVCNYCASEHYAKP